MVAYAFKRVVRSWKLFIALLLGVTLASSFFAGINISIDSISLKSLNQQIDQTYADIVVRSSVTSVLSSENISRLESIALDIEGVTSIDVISRVTSMRPFITEIKLPNGSKLSFRQFLDTVLAVSKGSYIYRNMMLEVGNSSELGEDEVYIEIDSDVSSKLKVGDNITLSIPVRVGMKTEILTKNLTVAGFVSIDDQSFLMAFGRYSIPTLSPLATFGIPRFSHNFLIIDWNRTFSKLIDDIFSLSPNYQPVITDLIVNLDRTLFLNPWDVESSRANLDTVTAQLKNTISISFGDVNLQVTNYLLSAIDAYESLSTRMTLQGVILALPVFFVAWYMSLTVSSVSFNLRRREIGLLQTKGFSSRQLLKLFLTEAIFIGIIGAGIGTVLGAAFTPIFTMGQFTEMPTVQIDTVVTITIFSIIIALLAVFKPARRAANLRAIDALREYIYIEEEKPHRKTWLWVALLLGAYKITMLLLGLDLATVLSPTNGVIPGIGPRGRGGFLINMLFQIAIFTDNVLTYVGSVLFFWGFTKIFVGSSTKFHEALGRLIQGFIKDLSMLTEKNIQRNVTRVVSMTFLLAVIVGYSVSAVGQIASQQDYITRLIHTNVGADVNVLVSSIDNVTSVMNELLTNVTGIDNATVEYRGFSGETSFEATRLVAIDPERWLSTAYYEQNWFIGSDIDQLMESLSNETIILESKFSRYLSLGKNISITLGGKVFNLRVIGFYGPEISSLTGLSMRQQNILRQSLHSYISASIYEQVNSSISATARILIKLKPEADGEEIAETIRNIPGVDWVSSVAEQLRYVNENILVSGPLNTLKLGVFFSAVAASIGTALVTVVSLQERKKEITLLMVRGLSTKQVVLTLIAENLSILLLSGILGGFVGYLIDRGNIAAMSVVSPLVVPEVIFTVDAIVTLVLISSFLIAAAVIPVVIIVWLSSSRLVWRI